MLFALGTEVRQPQVDKPRIVGSELQKSVEAQGSREGRLGSGQHQRKAGESKEKLGLVLTGPAEPYSRRAVPGTGILGRKTVLLTKGLFIPHPCSRFEVVPWQAQLD